MPVQRANITAELRGPLLILVIAIAVLSFSGFKVHDAVAAAARYQRDIRVAQTARLRVLLSALDEETGIRGYAATGDPQFLEPYIRARANVGPAFTRLRADLERLALDRVSQLHVTQIVDAEERLNARWIAQAAEPLRAEPRRSARTLALQEHGKAIVDAFRTQDEALQHVLAAAAAAADQNTERAVTSLLSFVIAALLALVAGTTAFGLLQARSARRTFENRLLYENQKRLADSLQMAFLNKNLPTSPNVGLHATYIPATQEAQVGGDWYDAFELPDKRILFSIGDVAGHGLEAAVVMSRARQAIIAAALHENDPAKVLERANDAILLQESKMVTAICGYVDPAQLEIVYATAGHPPPILAEPGLPPTFLPYEGIPLGILPHTTYRTFVTRVRDGAVMVLYTDGVIEHKRDVIEGQARLLEATRRAVLDNDPALSIQQYVFAGSPPTDDVAILTFTFKATPGVVSSVTSIGALQFNRLRLPTADAVGSSSVEAPFDLESEPHDDHDNRLRTALPAAALRR